MAKTPALPREVSDDILQRIKNGESVHALAREFNRHPANLYGLIKRRYGYEFPAKGAYWRPKIVIPTDPARLGYLAGLIDGEGSIQRRRDGLWSVRVGMTDEPVIRWLMSLGSGSFFVEPRPTPRKTCYTWSLGRRHDVLALLEAIEPYMMVKREVAQAAIGELRIRVAGGRFQTRQEERAA